MRYASLGLAIVVIVSTLLPITRFPMWWVRIWDFPRIQIAVLGVLAAIGLAFFGIYSSAVDLAVFSLTVTSVIYQAWMIFPYTPVVSPQTQRATSAHPDDTISFLFANVLMSNRNAEGLKKVLQRNDADVVLLVETDQWWLEHIRDEFAEYPFSVLHPLENTYGMLLFSRLELVSPELKFLVHDGVPSIHSRVRLPSGREIEMRCIHPPPPIYGEAVSSEPRDAELILVGKENRKDDTPFVVFGDLNDVAWSRTNYMFQNISGLLDPRVGRGFYSTFHAKLPFLRMPLDHLFHSNHFRLVEFRTLDYFGSDHFPVYVQLALEPDAKFVQEEPEPDHDELEEANGKLEYLERADPEDINADDRIDGDNDPHHEDKPE